MRKANVKVHGRMSLTGSVGERWLGRFIAVFLAAALVAGVPAAAQAQAAAAVVFTAGPPAVSSSSGARFEFSSEGAAAYECALDGAAFAPCESPAVISGLGDGRHTFAVRALGPAGEAGPTGAIDWMVDTVGPAASITSGPPAVSATAQATFSFTADEPGARFECAVDAGAFSSCSSPRTVSVSDGAHSFRVRAFDVVGNVGQVASASWGVDTVAPTVTLVEKPAAVTGAEPVRFRLTASEPAQLECRLRPRDRSFAPCGTTVGYSDLAGGDYTFETRATDGVGRTGPTASFSWTVDRTSPRATITSAPPALTTSTSATFAFTATESSRFVCALDGGGFDSCSSPRTYGTLAPGAHTFRVRAVDGANNASDAVQVTWVIIFAAAFDWAPRAPEPGQEVVFTSRSLGAVAAQEWDLDNDGRFDDGRGTSAKRTFAAAGAYQVRLRARHTSGETQIAKATVTVARQPAAPPTPTPAVVGTTAGGQRPVASGQRPVASFTSAPAAPVAGQVVTLTSTSTDAEGPIATTSWDLDNDGAYDDAKGATVTTTYPTAGTQTVGLRVVDADGLPAEAFKTIEIAPARGVAAPGGRGRPRMLTPFPVVRLAGAAVASGVRLRLFTVYAPRGTRVSVRCRGRGCPFRVVRRSISGKARTMRVHRLERRTLRAGIVIEVRVRRKGRVGKYTRVSLRAGAAPRRTDACLSAGRGIRITCPR